MSWKEDYIRRYSEAAYLRKLEKERQSHKAHPEKVKEHGHEQSRKGGKYYLHHLQYRTTGLQRERNNVRGKHRKQWLQYKKIIAPNSQIHHSWIHQSADYDGVALVERDAHQNGIIKVIEILEGEINLYTEKEIANRDEI